MSKGLETLKRIKEFYPQWHLYNREDFNLIETDLKEKEKQDEVLQIIKHKRVDVDWFIRFNNLAQYNYHCEMYDLPKLTKYEFKRLKEMLIDGEETN